MTALVANADDVAARQVLTVMAKGEAAGGIRWIREILQRLPVRDHTNPQAVAAPNRSR